MSQNRPFRGRRVQLLSPHGNWFCGPDFRDAPEAVLYSPPEGAFKLRLGERPLPTYCGYLRRGYGMLAGGTAFRSVITAVTIWAGTNGFEISTLSGTPCARH